jgi:DNA-binding transcriptional regulator YhcF (GntR family)
MSSSRNGPHSAAERPSERPAERTPAAGPGAVTGHELDIERDSDVPISTQIFWQLSYQIESARLQPGTRLPPVRELGAALRVNPNTVRAVYRRLADAGYVVGRHGAGTRVVDRPPVRRGGQALAGIVAETLRRAAQLGFTPDEVSQAMFTAATDRKRPGPHVRILFAECTTADATVDADRITEAFPERIEVIPVLLDELPDRLDRYHYDLVATTTFHADEAQAYVAGRVPVVAMLVGPGYMSLVHEIGGLPSGSRVGVVCGSHRGVDNIAEVLSLAGASGVEIISAVAHTEAELDQVDRDATLILLSREAMALGLESRFERPERLREWTYEFDPAAFELLRRALERVGAGVGVGVDPTMAGDAETGPGSDTHLEAG